MEVKISDNPEGISRYLLNLSHTDSNSLQISLEGKVFSSLTSLIETFTKEPLSPGNANSLLQKGIHNQETIQQNTLRHQSFRSIHDIPSESFRITNPESIGKGNFGKSNNKGEVLILW